MDKEHYVAHFIDTGTLLRRNTMTRELEQQLDNVQSVARVGKTTRRGFLKLVGAGAGTFALGGLIAACGEEPDDVDDEDEEPIAAPDDDDPDDDTDDAEVDDAEVDDAEVDDAEVDDEDPEEADDAVDDEPDDDEPVRGGTFRLGFDTSPEGFDPHAATNFASMNIYENVYEGLFEFDQDLELVNMLAESYEVVDDVTYQVTIRDDVSFHDGKHLTAEDVKYSYERMIDPDNAFPRVQWFGRIDTVEVDDDYTVTFTLEETFAPFLSYMGMQGAAIVDREMDEEHGDLMQVESANGTGPFKLVSYESDREARLEAFEDHWSGEFPYIDEIQWMIQSDESSRVAALRADEADMVRLFDVQNAMVLEDEFPLFQEFVTSRALTIVNCRNEPLDNPRVRQALSYAIDRQEFLEAAMFGEGQITGFLPPSEPAALPVDEFETFTHDVDRALEILEEEGYGDGFTIRLVGSPQYAMDISNAEVLQNQLREINVDVEIEQLEWGTLLDNMRGDRDFDLLNIIFTFQPDPDGYIYQYFHTDSSDNHSGISIPELDDLIEQGRTTIDPDERQEIYDELQRRLADEWVPMLTYFVYFQNFPVQERVQNWKMIPSISYKGLREVWLSDGGVE
jgi:peptide/nickel transport system substrate-binding protein